MKNKIFQIAIDSPAGSGAGTQAKLIAKYYNLLYLDTGKLYRILAFNYLKNNKKLITKDLRKLLLKQNLEIWKKNIC